MPRGGPSVFSDRSLRELLDSVAARTPAPGGGSSAAFTTALAASLVEMATSFTQDDLDPQFQRAGEMRTRALELAEIELHAYEAVLEALRLPHEDPQRPERIRAAQTEASQSPLEIARVAAELAELGADLAQTGNPNLAGDAIAGALLAEAAAQAAARLVAINLTEGADVAEAAGLARRALAARDAALATP
jgi:methenyltetrahydrofolate cyclohydrolase